MAEIELMDLCLSLGGRQILRSISLEVPKGKIVAVVGGSGSGKTSLLRCVSRLVRPTSGILRIFGQDLLKLDETSLLPFRQRMGVVFQYSALFDSLTIFENVSFGLRYARGVPVREFKSIVAEKLKMVGLPGVEHLYPEQLSGGMQKRVGLARALATSPEVLLYDEPTSGLDPIASSQIYRLICETRDRIGVTSLLVTHDIERVLQIADHICMLHEGQVIFSGSAEEMRQADYPAVAELVSEGTMPDLSSLRKEEER